MDKTTTKSYHLTVNVHIKILQIWEHGRKGKSIYSFEMIFSIFINVIAPKFVNSSDFTGIITWQEYFPLNSYLYNLIGKNIDILQLKPILCSTQNS